MTSGRHRTCRSEKAGSISCGRKAGFGRERTVVKNTSPLWVRRILASSITFDDGSDRFRLKRMPRAWRPAFVYDIILCHPIETCEFISIHTGRNPTLPVAAVHLQTSWSLCFFVSASSFFFCPKPGTWCKLPSFENIFYRRSSTILHIILYYAIDPRQKSIQKQAFEQQLLIKNPQPKQTRPWPRCHIHILQEKKFLYLCRNCSVRFKSETLVRSL